MVVADFEPLVAADIGSAAILNMVTRQRMSAVIFEKVDLQFVMIVSFLKLSSFD